MSQTANTLWFLILIIWFLSTFVPTQEADKIHQISDQNEVPTDKEIVE